MVVPPKIELLQPTEAQGFLAAAKGMFAGAEPLIEVVPVPLLLLRFYVVTPVKPV